MDTGKATELMCVIFAKMDKSQRQAVIKLLKLARHNLDFNYPNGVPEGDSKPKSNLILPNGAQ